ncbi:MULTISPECIES: hypothetical protein [Streptomyces]|uniref:Uncharacterized protein n=1 Tax=Streptomyces dengpaensis TaxID=2049881 RepID=A0ABN5HX54_9ACTN|nr:MULTISPECIES: hypothetical protein [Streptomyces]AVH55692.1 hypothetical protein C4B68_07785 [Streptomyces dengpaensis]PIB11954.1 hypothetical protein B1C81_01745 [Streptomyces sp. HG99]
MEPHEAVDAVAADLRDHQIPGDRHGLFTASRHIELLCTLAGRLACEAGYLHNHDSAGGPATPSAENLSQTAAHVGRAIAHYTQALAPLVTLAQPGSQATLQKQLDAIDLHSRLRVHLDDAGRAMAEARACLRPRRSTTPPATATVPVRAPTVRRRS